jgi:tetratricopeptide (TPR) repeat protein
MMALISKLTLRSIPSGTQDLVDVRSVVSEVIGSLDSKLPVVVSSEAEVSRVKMVKDQLQQVLLNVILNAQQELVQSGASTLNEGDIRIHMEEAGGRVVVTIVDRGPGISEERLRSLFQPFSTNKSTGLGLGLYQCKRIIEENGGSIRITSEMGRGTEVRIELLKAEDNRAISASAVFFGLLLSLQVILHAQPSLATPIGVQGEASKMPSLSQYDTGLGALAKQDLAAAESAFQEALKQDSKSIDALLGLAQVALKKNNAVQAESYLNKALSIAPNSAEVHTAWGRYHYWQKRFPLAEASFKKAITLNPKAIPPQLDLADLYLTALKKPLKATGLYKEVIKLEPQHAGAHYAMGMALASMAQPEEALSELRTAARLAPQNPLPAIAIARIYTYQGKSELALTAWSDALKLHPQLVQARLGRGDILAGLSQDDKALAEYGEALKIAPKLSDIYIRIGMIHERHKRLGEAEKAYLTAINLEPRQAIAYNNLAWIAVERNVRLDQARIWAEKAVDLRPGVPEFHDTLAWVYRARGDLDSAVSVLEKVTAGKSLQPETLYHLGIVYEEKGKQQQAASAYQKALELNKNFGQAQDAQQRLERLEVLALRPRATPQ